MNQQSFPQMNSSMKLSDTIIEEQAIGIKNQNRNNADEESKVVSSSKKRSFMEFKENLSSPPKSNDYQGNQVKRFHENTSMEEQKQIKDFSLNSNQSTNVSLNTVKQQKAIQQPTYSRAVPKFLAQGRKSRSQQKLISTSTQNLLKSNSLNNSGSSLNDSTQSNSTNLRNNNRAQNKGQSQSQNKATTFRSNTALNKQQLDLHQKQFQQRGKAPIQRQNTLPQNPLTSSTQTNIKDKSQTQSLANGILSIKQKNQQAQQERAMKSLIADLTQLFNLFEKKCSLEEQIRQKYADSMLYIDGIESQIRGKRNEYERLKGECEVMLFEDSYKVENRRKKQENEIEKYEEIKYHKDLDYKDEIFSKEKLLSENLQEQNDVQAIEIEIEDIDNQIDEVEDEIKLIEQEINEFEHKLQQKEVICHVLSNKSFVQVNLQGDSLHFIDGSLYQSDIVIGNTQSLFQQQLNKLAIQPFMMDSYPQHFMQKLEFYQQYYLSLAKPVIRSQISFKNQSQMSRKSSLTKKSTTNENHQISQKSMLQIVINSSRQNQEQIIDLLNNGKGDYHQQAQSKSDIQMKLNSHIVFYIESQSMEQNLNVTPIKIEKFIYSSIQFNYKLFLLFVNFPDDLNNYQLNNGINQLLQWLLIIMDQLKIKPSNAQSVNSIPDSLISAFEDVLISASNIKPIFKLDLCLNQDQLRQSEERCAESFQCEQIGDMLKVLNSIMNVKIVNSKAQYLNLS
eukprot:403333469